MAVIEAMALGLPAVGVNFLAIPEFVIEGQTGMNFGAHNVKELASRMVELAESREIIGLLSRNAVGKAREFSEAKILAEAERLLMELKKGR